MHRRYRQLLMEEGRQLRDEENRLVRKGLTPEEFEAEEKRGFELAAPASSAVFCGWAGAWECRICRVSI